MVALGNNVQNYKALILYGLTGVHVNVSNTVIADCITCPISSSTNSTSRIVPTGNCKCTFWRVVNEHGGFISHDNTLLRYSNHNVALLTLQVLVIKPTPAEV